MRSELDRHDDRSSFRDTQAAEGVEELATDRQLLVAAAGYDADRIKIDPSVVRGLEYYTGPVYEAELTFAVTNEKGETVRFGSVGGGGRYDGLVSRFMGEPVPATGFSIGVSRLMTALKNLGKLGKHRGRRAGGRPGHGQGRREASAATSGWCGDLRDAGIRAEMYLGGTGKKAQLKYADRRGAPAPSSRAATSARRAWSRSRT